MIIGIDGSRLTGRRTGTENYSQQVIAALIPQAQAHGHTIWLYVREPLPTDMPTPDEVVHIPQRRLWTHWGLGRVLAQRPPEVLFVPSHVLPLPCAWLRRPRTVVTIHDVGYRHFPQAHPLTQRLYLDWGTAFTARFADALIVDSRATQQDVGQFYSVRNHKMTVAHLGLMPIASVTDADMHTIRAKFNLPADMPYLLHIGTLQPRKNLRRLIEAFAASQAAALLVLAGGSGWGGENLAALVQQLGLVDRVRFTGYISELEKAALLRWAALYVCPSLYEGFGLPVLEAQSVGVPVVASNIASLPEIAGPNGALLIDPLDTPALANALQRGLIDLALRERLIQAGHDNVARFSWRACAATILAVLENAIK